MIKTSFWKDILYEIISSMDPWDMDITDLATRYSKKVEMMRDMNFRIPANVIIVSSVLLRMKSEIIGFSENGSSNNGGDYDPENPEGLGMLLDQAFMPDGSADFCESGRETEECCGGLVDGDGMFIGDELGLIALNDGIPIKVRPKRVPKRRVTAIELIAAIQEVLEDKTRRKVRKGNGGTKETVLITTEIDIGEIIETLYDRIMGILSRDKKAVVRFSELAIGREEIVSTLIPLLHLSNDQKIKITQENIFDEIFISTE